MRKSMIMPKQAHRTKNQKNNQPLPDWMTFLLLMIYLRTTPPRPEQQISQLLNRAIWAVTIILITLIMTTLGGAEHLAGILKALSIIP